MERFFEEYIFKIPVIGDILKEIGNISALLGVLAVFIVTVLFIAKLIKDFTDVNILKIGFDKLKELILSGNSKEMSTYYKKNPKFQELLS